MDFVVYLAFYNAADSRILTELSRDAKSTEYYLPEEVNDDITLLRTPPSSAHYVKLGVESSFVSLSVYGKECCTLLLKGKEIPIPLSSIECERVLLLRADDHFVTPAGRWSVLWEDEHGSISNSMRPPPLPVQPEPKDLGSDLGEVIKNLNEDDRLVHTTPQLGERVEYPNNSSSIMTALQPQTSGTTRIDLETIAAAQVVVTSTPYSTDAERDDIQAKKDLQKEDHCPLLDNQNRSELRRGALLESSHVQTMRRSQAAPRTSEPEPLCFDKQPHRSLSESPATTNGSQDNIGPLQEVDINVSIGRRLGPTKTAVQSEILPTDKAQTISSEGKYSNTRKRKRGSLSQQGRKRSKSATTKSSETGRLTNHQTNGYGKRSIVESEGVATNVPEAGAKEQDNFGMNGRHSIKSTGSATNSPALHTRSQNVANLTPASTAPAESSSERYDGSDPIVYFGSNTTIQNSTKVMRTFDRLGGRKAPSIATANTFCIAGNQLKKTSNLLIALTRGMNVVTEEWLIETHQRGYFLDLANFVPHDLQKEQEWRFCLRDAIQRGQAGLTHLLAGITVYFTPQLKQDLGTRHRELASVAEALGADTVKYRLPSASNANKAKKLLVLGVQNDAHTAEVHRVGARLHSKDILVMGVLRGRLEFDSEEFLLETPVKEEEQ